MAHRVQTFTVGALQSIQLIDPLDQDMSGALIFATTQAPGSDVGVDIAVAWGQDPERSLVAMGRRSISGPSFCRCPN